MQGLQFSKCPTSPACSPDSSCFYQTKYNQLSRRSFHTCAQPSRAILQFFRKSKKFRLAGRTTKLEREETFIDGLSQRTINRTVDQDCTVISVRHCYQTNEISIESVCLSFCMLAKINRDCGN